MSEADEIARFIAAKGVTRCPTAYVGAVAGGSTLDGLQPEPEPRFNRARHRFTKKQTQKWAWTGRYEKA